MSAGVASRIGWVINIELVAFGSLPFMASLMARGVGLPGDSLPAGGVAATSRTACRPLAASRSSHSTRLRQPIAAIALGLGGLKQWCVWVEPGPTTDRWAQRWQTAVNAALATWGEQVRLVHVSNPEDAQLRLWRRRPPLQNGRASHGRALLQLQQVQRQGLESSSLEPLVEVLISPGQRQAAIQATALHELGHGFGLWGHSELSSDVMGAVPAPNRRWSSASAINRRCSGCLSNPAPCQQRHHKQQRLNQHHHRT